MNEKSSHLIAQEKKRRMFTFDLKIESLKKEFGEKNYTKGWKELGKTFKTHNFFNAQQSVYISKDELSLTDLLDIVKDIREKNPWLKTCLKSMKIGDIGILNDVTQYFYNDKASERKTQNKKEDSLNIKAWDMATKAVNIPEQGIGKNGKAVVDQRDER